MNQPRNFLALVAFFVLCFSFTKALAQTPPAAKPSEPSFDVILQTVIASNEVGGKSDVAPSLSGVIKKLKTDFPFSNSRLASTSVQRVNNRGNVEIRSVSYLTDKNLPVFSDWSIRGLESLIDESKQEMIQIQDFRFGQRIPITNSNNTVSFEQIGLTSKFGLTKNMPTTVGSLTTSKPDELMFLILTVRAAEK